MATAELPRYITINTTIGASKRQNLPHENEIGTAASDLHDEQQEEKKTFPLVLSDNNKKNLVISILRWRAQVVHCQICITSRRYLYPLVSPD